jgi:hypothetical protein
MNQPLSQALRDDLAQRFEHQGRHVYGSPNAENSSPLYAHLSVAAAGDPDILALVVNADRATQIPNLLFGAVHYLLLGGMNHPLSEFFPDLVESPRPIDKAYPAFRSFCLEHAEAIERLVTTRRVQTNEVRRCAGLLPAFGWVAQRGGGQPLAMLEIGCSAGLHLRWDDYGYDYGEAGKAGNKVSPVQIVSAVRGNKPPPLPSVMPSAAYRAGLELNPVDLNDETATRWLRALIWPEHHDRARLLEAALEHFRQNPARIIAGNAAETLPAVLEAIPADTTLCVYHSYALIQMPKDVREQILSHLLVHGRQRDFYRVSQEWYSGQHQPHLDLYTYRNGEMQAELLAYVETHGRWVEWLYEH